MKRPTKEHHERIRQTVLKMVDHFGSQAALAAAARCQAPSVHYWTTGEKRPGLSSLLRIEAASGGKFKAAKIRPELF